MSATPHPPPRARRRPAARTVLAWCAAATYPVVMVAAMDLGLQGFGPEEFMPIVLLTALVVSLLRRGPLPALALLLVGWFGAVWVQPNGVVAILMMVITDGAVGYIAAFHARRTSIGAAAMTAVTQVGFALLTTHASALTSVNAAIVLALAGAWMAGNTSRQRRLHTAELAAQATVQAVTAERLRIARELHDMVAHSIGIIAIQAGVGSRVIDTQPGETRKSLDAIEATSRETLAGLRRMLVALRRTEPEAVPHAAPLDPAPGLADLERLVTATMDAGIRVDLRWQGERRPLPAEVDLSAFRIVQEAITNVARHAGTDHCRVSVGYTDDEVSVEIVDDGRGHGTTAIGYGLVGMRERVGMLNGALTAGPRPGGGFRVAARLPAPAGAR